VFFCGVLYVLDEMKGGKKGKKKREHEDTQRRK
jgi:hypothetical protein